VEVVIARLPAEVEANDAEPRLGVTLAGEPAFAALSAHVPGFLPAMSAHVGSEHRVTLVRAASCHVDVLGISPSVLASAGLEFVVGPSDGQPRWRVWPDGSRFVAPRAAVRLAQASLEVPGLARGVDYEGRLEHGASGRVLAAVSFRPPCAATVTGSMAGALPIRCDARVRGLVVVRDREGQPDAWRGRSEVIDGTGWAFPPSPCSAGAVAQAWGDGWRGRCTIAAEGITIAVEPLATWRLTWSGASGDPEVTLRRGGRSPATLEWLGDQDAYAQQRDSEALILRGLRPGDHLVVRDPATNALVVLRPDRAERRLHADFAAVRVTTATLTNSQKNQRQGLDVPSRGGKTQGWRFR
jgi:hypothetical protein